LNGLFIKALYPFLDTHAFIRYFHFLPSVVLEKRNVQLGLADVNTDVQHKSSEGLSEKNIFAHQGSRHHRNSGSWPTELFEFP
jgi:hypothetical protein